MSNRKASVSVGPVPANVQQFSPWLDVRDLSIVSFTFITKGTGIGYQMGALIQGSNATPPNGLDLGAAWQPPAGSFFTMPINGFQINGDMCQGNPGLGDVGIKFLRIGTDNSQGGQSFPATGTVQIDVFGKQAS